MERVPVGDLNVSSVLNSCPVTEVLGIVMGTVVRWKSGRFTPGPSNPE